MPPSGNVMLRNWRLNHTTPAKRVSPRPQYDKSMPKRPLWPPALPRRKCRLLQSARSGQFSNPVERDGPPGGSRAALALISRAGHDSGPPPHWTLKERRLPRKPSLSRYLRDARIARGLSVAALAERIGVNQVSIYFWEGGRVRPRDVNLSALCKALKLPIRRTREIAAG